MRYIAWQTGEHVNNGYDWMIFDTYNEKAVHENLNYEQAFLLAAYKNDRYEVDYTQF